MYFNDLICFNFFELVTQILNKKTGLVLKQSFFLKTMSNKFLSNAINLFLQH